EPTLLVGLRGEQPPVEAVDLRVLAEDGIEAGEALQRARVLRPDLGGDARVLEVAPPRHVVLEALVGLADEPVEERLELAVLGTDREGELLLLARLQREGGDHVGAPDALGLKMCESATGRSAS